MALRYEHADAGLIGALCSQFCLGVYATTFSLYIQIKRQRKSALGFVGYGIITLFLGTVLTITLDAVQQFYTARRGAEELLWLAKVNALASLLSITLDFLSQIILIYRCWNVWDRVLWVAIPPSILATTSWACGIAVASDMFIHDATPWWVPLGMTTMGLSLGVNAAVSGLMIARICPLAFVASALLESAIAIFVAQVLYIVLYKFSPSGFALIAGPVTITYGLNCTAIMVRVTLNQSYEVTGTSNQHSFMAFAPAMAQKNNIHLSELGASSSTAPGESERVSREYC